MRKLLIRFFLYGIGFFLILEVLVRSFHLYNEYPIRFLDNLEVEKWVPDQSGISITGNRKQNVGHYKINSLGFNCIHEFYEPTDDDVEIALIGDSFIEGFHQDVENSLGQKTEKLLDKTVYEFGYSGYDFADEMHLMHQYNDLFQKIDYRIIYMRYSDDLDRDAYKVSNRLGLDTPVSRLIKHVKTVIYIKDIGLVDPVVKKMTNMVGMLKSLQNAKSEPKVDTAPSNKNEQTSNFISLVDQYQYNKNKNMLLIDSRIYPKEFLIYLKEHNFEVIDFGPSFEASKEPPTLIYDQHWNNHGRTIIANLIAKKIAQKLD